MSFSNDSLAALFKLNFSLLHNQKIDFRMFDDMIVWERDSYVKMLIDRIAEENELTKLKNQELKAAKLVKRPMRPRKRK